MSLKKDPVATPLHLLQQLSHSLVTHLQKACSEAQQDAELLLAKLEKQRGRTQEKIIKARAKLDEAGSAGKSKAQAKARSRLAELDDMLALLQARQSETLTYLAELKRDAEQSIQLAKGVTQVEQAATQALASRSKPAASRNASRSKTSTRRATPAADHKAGSGKAPETAAQPASRSTAAKNSAASKLAETKTPNSKASSPSQRSANGAAKAKPAAVKKPAARKPTPAKRESVNQSPPPAAS